MNLSWVLHQVALDKTLAHYYQDTRQFIDYLRTTSRCEFRIHGERRDLDGSPWDEEKSLEYVHRWTITYRRSVLAKFYQLEDWHEANPAPITMLTLTTYHGTDKNGQEARYEAARGMTIEDSFNLLKSSWLALRKSLGYYLPGVPWVWIMEPHQSGYPHLHVVLFADIDRGTQEAIKRLWSEKYQAGSFEHGADFAVSKPEQSIQSIRNYLVKYVAKGFTSTGSRFGEGDAWTPGQIVFYALVKKHSWRLFGASHDLCKVMAYNKKTDKKTAWYATELLDSNGESHTTWLKEGYHVPPRIESIEEKSL